MLIHPSRLAATTRRVSSYSHLLRGATAKTASRPFTSPSTTKPPVLTDRVQDTDIRGDVPLWIQRFNNNITKDPTATIPLFLVLRNGTWYALVSLISQTMTVGPEFAVAYLAVRLTGKFRRPLDIALAALLSKSFPLLSQVKMSALIAPSLPPDDPSHNTAMGKAMAWLSAPMDKYGFSFYLSCKMTGFVSIAGVAAAIRYGLDISSALTWAGVPETIQDASGAFGLATLVNISLIPVHFALTAALAPKFSDYICEMRGINKK